MVGDGVGIVVGDGVSCDIVVAYGCVVSSIVVSGSVVSGIVVSGSVVSGSVVSGSVVSGIVVSGIVVSGSVVSGSVVSGVMNDEIGDIVTSVSSSSSVNQIIENILHTPKNKF